MTIRTTVLDRAAFFTTFGAKITRIEGTYPDNTFTIESPRWVAFYQRWGGWIPHNRFCNQRRAIKRKARVHAGLPRHFTGHMDTTFKLGDIAFWKPLTHLETLLDPTEQQSLKLKWKELYERKKR